MITTQDKTFLKLALEQARQSAKDGGFPAGSVLVNNEIIIAKTTSVGSAKTDFMSHSDHVALFRNRTLDLNGSTLYSSVAPCLMCLGTASWAGVKRIVYACNQEELNPAYYGTKFNSVDINKELLTPIEIEQATEFQDDSLNLVKEWESKL
ncbi:MAG: nucleoside deaminase [bacterium]